MVGRTIGRFGTAKNISRMLIDLRPLIRVIQQTPDKVIANMRELKLDEVQDIYGGAGDQATDNHGFGATDGLPETESFPWQLSGRPSGETRWF